MEGLESNNVLIAGFQKGFGPFRPALFISKPLLNTLKKEELQAIILHEISHIKLNHLRNRFIFSSGLLIFASLLSGLTVLLFHLLTGGSAVAPLAGLSTLVTMMIISFRKIAEQNRFHELEADIHAIQIGSTIDDFEGALRKMDQLNQLNTNRRAVASEEHQPAMSADGHPSTDERIRILREYFARTEKNNVQEDKAA
jgi:Zn-dependent protease with chaperone function